MDTWSPMPDLVESNIFTMDEEVFLLYKDNFHFSLLVNRNDGIDEDRDLGNDVHQTNLRIEFERLFREDLYSRDFIENLHLSLF